VKPRLGILEMARLEKEEKSIGQKNSQTVTGY